MIDIHSHIIPNVDDGCKSLIEAKELLLEEVKQGVSDIILTPHHRHHMFEASVEEVNQSFFNLQELVKKEKIGVNLYLGQEIYIRKYESLKRNLDEVKNGEALTFGKSKYVLLEFSYTEEIDLPEVVYMTIKNGYIPIIAHLERYQYIDDANEVYEMIKNGALIQINASSVIGKDGRKVKRFVNSLIKEDLVHFVSSDIHYNRINYMQKAYRKVAKKHGKEVANRLFSDNAKKYLLEVI